MGYKRKLLAGWAMLTLFISFAYAAPGMRAFAADSLQGIVHENKGKPFVLVVWSLDCSYCQTSLGNIAAERGRGRNLRVVTLSTDAFDDAEAMAQAALRLKAVGFAENAWAFGDAPPEQLRYALDPRWHGEKPRSYWFDAKGNRTAYSGVITPEVMDKFMPKR